MNQTRQTAAHGTENRQHYHQTDSRCLKEHWTAELSAEIRFLTIIHQKNQGVAGFTDRAVLLVLSGWHLSFPVIFPMEEQISCSSRKSFYNSSRGVLRTSQKKSASAFSRSGCAWSLANDQPFFPKAWSYPETEPVFWVPFLPVFPDRKKTSGSADPIKDAAGN